MFHTPVRQLSHLAQTNILPCCSFTRSFFLSISLNTPPGSSSPMSPDLKNYLPPRNVLTIIRSTRRPPSIFFRSNRLQFRPHPAHLNLYLVVAELEQSSRLKLFPFFSATPSVRFSNILSRMMRGTTVHMMVGWRRVASPCTSLPS